MTPAEVTPALISELRSIEVFAKLTPDQLAWFISNSELWIYEPGAYVGRAGDPADVMIVILEGCIHARLETANGTADTNVYIIAKGDVSGVLPFSRMTTFSAAVRATEHTRVLSFPKSKFPELYQECPELIPGLVGILTDRVRETTRSDTQTEKLAALGKLSAGLAHELNNPAAAARQAAASSRDLFTCYRETMDEFAALKVDASVLKQLRDLETRAAAAVHHPCPLDSLSRSDREDSIAEWLTSVEIEDAWRAAPAFVEAGFDLKTLQEAFNAWEPKVRELAIYRVAAAIEIEQILAQMENSTTRMSELVVAMKDYSYLDRASIVEVDLNYNIDVTLKMFGYRLKKGIEVIKNYDAKLPALCANGGQLNQVWTNIIDNALDAIEEYTERAGPGRLTIDTSAAGDHALVQITDNGHGIPEKVKNRIFDPFFTTKKQGEGTGLGLESAYRIIRQHHGDIRFTSEPGETTFSVRLPMKQPA